MAIDIRRRLDPWVGHEPIQGTTEDEAEAGRRSAQEVIEKVNEILGYDIFEAALLAEGYREFAAESLRISESTLAAQFEVLPPE